MKHFKLGSYPYSVEYGVYSENNVYLRVRDERLDASKRELSEEILNVMSDIGKKGSYVSLYTGKSGEGIKVSGDVMRKFLKRYGATSEYFPELFPETNECTEKDCVQFAEMRCSKCQLVYYCSRNCQSKDWSFHKLICMPLPKKVKEKSVYAIFFPHYSKKPSIVEVGMELCWLGEPGQEENVYTYIPNLDIMSDSNTKLKNVLLPYAGRKIMREYTDTLELKFSIDETLPPNECLKKITKGKAPINWRGNLLLLKYKGKDLEADKYPKYMDIDARVLNDFIEALKCLGD
jgi:hypothetical protein